MMDSIPPFFRAFIDQVTIARDTQPDIPRAVEERRCITPPAGCGQPLPTPNPFLDPVSQREYENSGLCQKCQDRYFAPDPSSFADLDANSDYERCGECGEYRPLQYVDVGVGTISGHNCCSDIRFGDRPRPPRCIRTQGCFFGENHVHHCETATFPTNPEVSQNG